MSTSLYDFLIKRQVLTNEHIGRLSEKAQHASDAFAVMEVVTAGLFNEEELAKFLAEAFNLSYHKISNLDMRALTTMTAKQMTDMQCVPFGVEENNIIVAISDPTRLPDLERIRGTIKKPLKFVVATHSNLSSAIKKSAAVLSAQATAESENKEKAVTNKEAISAVGEKETNPVEAVKAKSAGVVPANSVTSAPATSAASVSSNLARESQRSSPRYPIKKIGSTVAIPKVIDEVLIEAIAVGASDVHFECQAKFIRVRFRLEGQLHDTYQIPLELRDQLVSRLKVLAGLDTAERKLPQDGRIKLHDTKSEFTLRISIMPANLGESIAIRIPKAEGTFVELSRVGFSQKQYEQVLKGIESPHGMILVTGPTGSGKTTTLYSVLNYLNTGLQKISTVEDPIESTIEGIVQTQINPDTGMTFPIILKALLRQDPDVLLVGEIRDHETALVATQAALTGHLVLSTLHTNDAPSAVLRLLNMGMEPFMVAAAVNTVVAQRLVRRICQKCKTEISVPQEYIQTLGESQNILNGAKIYKGAGCHDCRRSGYKGRAVAVEVLTFTDSLKEMLLKGENPVNFRKSAIASGMTTLRQSALRLVAAGETTIEEALSATEGN